MEEETGAQARMDDGATIPREPSVAGMGPKLFSESMRTPPNSRRNSAIQSPGILAGPKLSNFPVADLLAALSESFKMCDAAIEKLTAANMAAMTTDRILVICFSSFGLLQRRRIMPASGAIAMLVCAPQHTQ